MRPRVTLDLRSHEGTPAKRYGLKHSWVHPASLVSSTFQIYLRKPAARTSSVTQMERAPRSCRLLRTPQRSQRGNERFECRKPVQHEAPGLQPGPALPLRRSPTPSSANETNGGLSARRARFPGVPTPTTDVRDVGDGATEVANTLTSRAKAAGGWSYDPEATYVSSQAAPLPRPLSRRATPRTPQATAPGCSSEYAARSLSLFDRDGFSGRTYPAHSAQTGR